jgi:hypothetical protein
MFFHKTLIILILGVAALYKISNSIIISVDNCPIYNNCNRTESFNRCLAKYKCECDVIACKIDLSSLDQLYMGSIITYSISILIFLGIIFCGKPSEFIRETNLKIIIKKLIIIFIMLLLYVIFNLFSDIILHWIFGNINQGRIGTICNIPWILLILLIPIYVIFGTTHNTQIRRAIYIKKLLNNLKNTRSPNDIIDDDCSICLNKLEDDVIITDCNHQFHRNCIRDLIIVTNVCPLCRNNIISQ